MTREDNLTKLTQIIQQGMTFHRQGKLSEAASLYASALTRDPRHADALHMLGVVKLQQDKPDEAVDLIAAAAKQKPRAPDILSNLALAQVTCRRYADALATYGKLITAAPPNADLFQAQGFVLSNLGRHDDAVKSFDRALQLAPGHAMAQFNRGNALAALGRRTQALAAYDKVLAQDPRQIDGWNNRGNILAQSGRYRDALESYDKALALNPNHLDALSNRGNALRELQRYDEAMTCYDRALGQSPNHVGALYNKSNALVRLKRYDEAVAHLKKAALLAPGDAQTANLLAICYLAICAWDEASALFASLKSMVQAGQAVEPFTFLTFGAEPSEQLACAKIYLKGKTPEAETAIRRAPPARPEKLRVAYVSSDFRQHPVATSIVQILERHDRSKIEVIGVSLGVDDDSEIRARIVKACDRFHDMRGVGDRDVVKTLRDLPVDIAIDLNGHTDGARQGIFLQRAAPVQVNYLGFAGTMGSKHWDYIVADAQALPSDQQPHYAEKIVHLPDSFFPRDRDRDIPGGPKNRMDAGLPERGIVYCCFNNVQKISKPSFSAWMRILARVEGSVLWLREVHDAAKRNLQEAAREQGIDPARLVFAPRLERLDDHLARHRFADLFLDALPFNAHTTASDALGAGLPVLTCAGKTFAGRVASSLVRAAGLPELVCDDPSAYEAFALELSKAPDRLRQLREKLAAQKNSAPLFDGAMLCRHLEKAYAAMWERYARGLNPQSFAVARDDIN